MIDWDKIGKFIAELRKESGMTQVDLSKRLYTSRENISKWERGINNPTTETLIELSKIFGVSVNELLAGERKTEVNVERIDNISANALKEGDVKVKKMLIKSIIIIVGILLIFFIYYFISTYNTIYVYKISGENENFATKDGLVLFSKNKSYLKLGDIISDDNLDYDSVELAYYDKNNNKHTLCDSDESNLVVMTSYRSNEVFSYEHMEEIVSNTYLIIKYNDKEEKIKLKFMRDMHNSFKIFNSNDDKIDDSGDKNKSNSELETLENKFEYDEENNLYIYIGKTSDYEFKIEYSEVMETYKVYEYLKDNTYTFEYNTYTKSLNIISRVTDSEVQSLQTYNYETKECYTDKCDEKQINHFFDDYYNKYKVEK